MIPYKVDAEQLKRKIKVEPTLSVAYGPKDKMWDIITPLISREQAATLWEDLTDTPKTKRYHYAWNEDFTSLKEKHDVIILVPLQDRVFINFNGKWYGILKQWCIDPFALDPEIENPKELLAAVFDDLINRPPPLWEWYDYRQQIKNLIL